MIALVTQIADFGADYTGIGWFTVVLPLALVAIVVALWARAYKRDGGAPSDTPVASGRSEEGSRTTDSAVLLPLVPALMLPLALALALTVVVAVLWWHTTRRAQH